MLSCSATFGVKKNAAIGLPWNSRGSCVFRCLPPTAFAMRCPSSGKFWMSFLACVIIAFSPMPAGFFLAIRNATSSPRRKWKPFSPICPKLSRTRTNLRRAFPLPCATWVTSSLSIRRRMANRRLSFCGPARGKACFTGTDRKMKKRQAKSSESLPSSRNSILRDTFSSSGTSSVFAGEKTFWSRDAAPRPTVRSATRWELRPSILSAWSCCSNASFPRSGASGLTLISIFPAATSASALSSMCTNATENWVPPCAPMSSPTAASRPRVKLERSFHSIPKRSIGFPV